MKSESVNPKNTFVNLPELKRQRILLAMVQEFAQHGYRKASLNAIVEKSGISKGSLYQYFSSKEEMFLFVFEQFTNLVKKSIILQMEEDSDHRYDFWARVKCVLLAGIGFIDNYPEYFQLYLRVLFEHDLPRREELITRVRLFSREYFSPLVEQAQQSGLLRPDLSVQIIVFSLDAMLDRFLQGYCRPYLDGGLGVSTLSREQLNSAVDDIIDVLQCGLKG